MFPNLKLVVRLATFALVILASGARAQIPIAVVYDGVDATGAFGISNAVSFLSADPRFSSVTSINAGVSTPTLATLQAFTSVLVVTDNRNGTITGGGSGTMLGNVLKDYVNGGGRTVFGAFSGDTVIGIDGAILTIAPYTPGPNNAAAGAINFATAQTSHPVFAGVSSFSSTFANNIGVSASGILLASYVSGTPAVITNSTNSIMFVNGFPGDQADYANGTQFGRLFANALALRPANAVPEPGSLALIVSLVVTAGGLTFTARRRKK